jgi:proteasome lid subunit RPN8/RPN11
MSGGVHIPGLTRRVGGAIYDHIFDNDGHEVGGVLVGVMGDGPMPVVTGSIAALEARGERASVTFTHEAWSSIHQQLESDFPDAQIVGWYHSHPGFGIFLSSHDLFIHQNFFADPRQIAYVVDPHAGTEGVFGWRDGEIVLLEERPTSRRGTGGPSGPGESASGRRMSDGLRYGGLALVVAMMVGAAVALLAGGGDEPGPASAPVTAPLPTAPVPGSPPTPRPDPAPRPGPAPVPDPAPAPDPVPAPVPEPSPEPGDVPEPDAAPAVHPADPA